MLCATCSGITKQLVAEVRCVRVRELRQTGYSVVQSWNVVVGYRSIASIVNRRVEPDADGNTDRLNRSNIALGVRVRWQPVLIHGRDWKREERIVTSAVDSQRVEVDQCVEVNWASVVHQSTDCLWHITELYTTMCREIRNLNC